LVLGYWLAKSIAERLDYSYLDISLWLLVLGNWSQAIVSGDWSQAIGSSLLVLGYRS